MEVKVLRAESLAIKEVVADLILQDRILKKTRARLGATANEMPSIREARDHSHRRAIPPSGPLNPGPDWHSAHNLLPLV